MDRSIRSFLGHNAKINTMKRLFIPLIAASVAIGGAAPVLGDDELHAATNDFAIIIDGKTKNIELWVTPNQEGADRLIKNSGLHSSTVTPYQTGEVVRLTGGGIHGPASLFSYDGAGGRIMGRGKCSLPPNSSIGAFRNTSLDFVTGIIFDYETSRKRNSKLVTKTDELRKDGTYVAVIERTTLGYHH